MYIRQAVFKSSMAILHYTSKFRSLPVLCTKHDEKHLGETRSISILSVLAPRLKKESKTAAFRLTLCFIFGLGSST